MLKLPSIAFVAAIVTMGCLVPAFAQQNAKVTVRSAMFPGAGIEDSLVLYTGEGKEGAEVPVWGGKFSPEFKLPRQEVWRFGEWETGTNDQGKVVPVFKERGRVKPPAGQRLWLVFFREKAEADSPLKVRAFSVDQGSLKEGGAVVMNLSVNPVGAQIGDRKVSVKPGSQAVVEPGSKRGQSYPVKFFYPHNGQLRPFVATTWFHGERRRRLAIVLQAGEGTPPKLLTVDDIAAKEDEPAR